MLLYCLNFAPNVNLCIRYNRMGQRATVAKSTLVGPLADRMTPTTNLQLGAKTPTPNVRFRADGSTPSASIVRATWCRALAFLSETSG